VKQIAVALAVLALSLPAPARAYTTQVAQGNPAVRIDGCQAFTQRLYRTNTGRLVEPGHKALFERLVAPQWVTHLGAGFTNVGRRPIRDVQITFLVRDPQGRPRAAHDAVWTGPFAPGKRYDFEARGFAIGRTLHVPVRTVQCRVTRVDFAR
jgi:hypothetical protein